MYLDGSSQTNPAVHLTTAGKPVAPGIALVAVAPEAHSLESQLSAVFSRAALFGPAGWGAGPSGCCSWLVAVGLGLAGFAVAAAAGRGKTRRRVAR